MLGKYTSNPSGNDRDMDVISIMFGQLAGGMVVLDWAGWDAGRFEKGRERQGHGERDNKFAALEIVSS
jgi:hypothetical protein